MSKYGTEQYKKLVQSLRNSSDLKEEEDYFIKEQAVEVLKWDNATPGASKTRKKTKPQPRGLISLLTKERGGDSPRQVDICERSWIFEKLAHAPPFIYRIYVTPEKKSLAEQLLARI